MPKPRIHPLVVVFTLLAVAAVMVFGVGLLI